MIKNGTMLTQQSPLLSAQFLNITKLSSSLFPPTVPIFYMYPCTVPTSLPTTVLLQYYYSLSFIARIGSKVVRLAFLHILCSMDIPLFKGGDEVI